MKKLTLSFLLSLLTVVSLVAQPSATFSVAWYNVENLFDTYDNVNPYGKKESGDDEFLPTNKWTQDRYELKLRNIAKVINAMNDGNGPDIIGFCEIENQDVIWDLINKHFVNKKWRLIYKESQDARSIDVVLAYRADKFSWNWMSAYALKLPDDYPSRDVVSVELSYENQPIYFLLNHWPSKRGGEEKSNPNRVEAAKKANMAIEDIKRKNPAAPIFLMGDFNANPDEEPVRQTLGSINVANYPTQKSALYNLVEPLWDREKIGTYQYSGKWDMIDHFIVNEELLIPSGFYVPKESVRIINDEFLTETSGKYKGAPFRSFAGQKYLGGYSDHFAIECKLIFYK